MDQNEKLAMFGLTYVLAIDGYSGKIVRSSGTTFSYTIMCMGEQLTVYMPVKNNLLIIFISESCSR